MHFFPIKKEKKINENEHLKFHGSLKQNSANTEKIIGSAKLS